MAKKKTTKPVSGMNLDKNKPAEPEVKKRKSIDFKRFVNKKTLTIGTMSALALGGLAVGTNAQAQEMVKTTANEVSVAVMKTRHSTEFAKKDVLLESEKIQEESNKALANITAEWTDNTAEEIQAEIERQREAGLDAYVVQWGDTVSVLADVLGTTVEDLVARNNISDRHLILAGDILDGVLYQTSNADRISDEDLVAVSTDVTPVTNPENTPGGTESEVAVEGETTQLEGEEAETEETDEEINEGDSAEGEGVSGDENPDTGDSDPTEDPDTPVANDNPETPVTDDVEGDVVADEPVINEGEEPVGDDVVDDIEDVVVGEDPDTEPIEVPDEQRPEDGERQLINTFETYEIDDVPFEITYVEDDTLDEGVEIIDEKGATGMIRIDKNVQEYSDGTTVEEETGRTTLAEPITEVIRVGTAKVEGSVDEAKTTTAEEIYVDYIEFDEERVVVDHLAPGAEEVHQTGQFGTRYSKVEVTIDEDGNIVDETVVDDNFEGSFNGEDYAPVEPVKQIVHVGRDVTEDTEYDMDDVEVERIEVEVDVKAEEFITEIPAGEEFMTPPGEKITLDVGEQFVEQEAQDGVVLAEYDVFYLDGVEVGRELVPNNYPTFKVNLKHRIVYIGI